MLPPILRGAKACCLTEGPAEVVRVGKAALFGDLIDGKEAGRKQLFCLSEPQLQDVLLGADPEMLFKKLTEIDLADSAFGGKESIGKGRIREIGFKIPDRRQQDGVGGRALCAESVEYIVKDAHGLGLPFGEQKTGFQLFKVSKIAFWIVQRDQKKGIYGQIFTLEIDQRKVAGFVSVKMIVCPFGQKHSMISVGDEFLAPMGVGDLTAITKGEPVAAAALHLKVSAFGGTDSHSIDQLRYGYTG